MINQDTNEILDNTNTLDNSNTSVPVDITNTAPICDVNNEAVVKTEVNDDATDKSNYSNIAQDTSEQTDDSTYAENETLDTTQDTTKQSYNRIFCYTGTGNCYAAAKQFSQHFDNMPVEFILQEMIDTPQTVTCDFCIITLPSYAFGVPLLVKRWLKATKFNVEYLTVAVLQGSNQRGTTAEIFKLLRKQGQKVAYSSGVDSVENYVHLFGHQKENKIISRTEAQRLDVEKLCRAYEARETNKPRMFRPFSRFVSVLFRGASHLFTKRYRILDTCNACQICRMVCPPNAITMIEKKGRTIPKFKGTRCDHCQACMQLCPKRAIKYFRIKPKSPRYLHKDVTLGELIKRK